MGYFTELKQLVLRPRLGGLNGLALPHGGKTYTFRAQDVYVLLAIRIRSDQAGYTLQAKGLVTLVLVVLVKMETRLERTGAK